MSSQCSVKTLEPRGSVILWYSTKTLEPRGFDQRILVLDQHILVIDRRILVLEQLVLVIDQRILVLEQLGLLLNCRWDPLR